MKVTRTELENISKDLIARVKIPLQTALLAANMTMVKSKAVDTTRCLHY